MTVLREKPADPKSIAEISVAERLESLKAGGFGGVAATIATAAAFLLNQGLSGRWLEFALLRQSLGAAAIGWTIALLSGFLFAVTYRYVIRRDRNPHLRSGAVMAFGLVRGLAQLEAGLQAQITLLPAVVLLTESVVLFTIARLVLDGAIAQGWVKPFASEP
jgi:hypothetical protein